MPGDAVRARDLLAQATSQLSAAPEKARALLEEALERVQDTDDRRTLAEVAERLALVLSLLHRGAEGLPHAERAAETYGAVGLRSHADRVRLQIARTLVASKRAAEAEPIARAVVAAMDAGGDRSGAAMARMTHGWALVHLQRPREAAEVLEAALGPTLVPPYRHHALHLLIHCEVVQGQYRRARARCAPDLPDLAAIEAFLDLYQGDPDRAAGALASLCAEGAPVPAMRWCSVEGALVALFDARRVAHRLAEAETVLARLEGTALAPVRRAELLLARGRHEDALTALASAPPDLTPLQRLVVETLRSDALRELRSLDEADQALVQAEPVAATLDGDATPCWVAVRRGLLEAARGRADLATASADRVQAHLDAEDIGPASELGLLQYRLRLALHALGAP